MQACYYGGKCSIGGGKMQLNDLKDRLGSYVRQQAKNIIKDHICKGCLTLVEPGKGVFGAVGKEESALWCEKCWRTKELIKRKEL